MPSGIHRFFVRSADGRMIVGYNDLNVARAVDRWTGNRPDNTIRLPAGGHDGTHSIQ